MPRCEECTELLLDFVYELLDAEQARQVREHLDGCADCQAALQEALGQKAILARAAQVIREVPPFAPPSETAAQTEPQPAVVARSPTVTPAPTAGLPEHQETCGPPQWPGQRPGHNSGARRRPVWAWVASAAAVLVCAIGLGYYQHGLAVRQDRLVELRREVTDIEARLASVEVDFRKGLDDLVSPEAGKELRLQVTGPAVYHSEVENRYRVATEDLEGNALSGKVEARLVDGANKEIFRSEEMPIRGERVVSLPAGLAVQAGAQTRLEIRAGVGKRTEELKEEVVAAPADPLTQLALNKRLYHVGEIVFFRSVTLDRYTLRPPEKPQRLQQSLRDDKGKTVLALVNATGAGGISSGEFAVTKDLAEGEYTLQVADEAGRPLASRTLRVVRDVPAGLYFNRPRYRPGDKVVASYQAPRSAKDAAVANQAVTVNVLQENGKPVEGMSQPVQVFTDKLGQANIEFQLPRYTPAAPARLEIQLHDGKREEKMVREIPLALPQPRVEFFPEGGELLAEAPNRVYFRATTSLGEPADLEGRVIDSQGQTVAQARTEPHDAVRGLGVFTLTPRSGETYRLQITSPPGTTTVSALPEARAAGVALHVENPVDAEGEPVRVTVRSEGAKRLLLVAACRERTVAQQFVQAPSGSFSTSLAPARGAQGTLRVTAYEVRAGRVTPLAERLVYREPARRLALSASTDLFAYPPGDAVRLKVRSVDENGAAVPAWLAALVVDERVLPDDPSLEQSMPAFFYLLSEVGQARDLDNADVLLAPGDQARRALDLFLGTHGWRRFVPATAPAEKAAWFHRDNRDALLLRQKQAVATARADLEAKRERAAELRDREDSLRDRARLAFLDLTHYEQQPRQMVGIGLGVLVAALLLVGAGLLLWGLVVLVRGGVARPHFLVAMALLGGCLLTLLAFGNRSVALAEPDSLAWLQTKPRPDLGVPPQKRPPPPPPVAALAASSVKRSLEGPQGKVEGGGRAAEMKGVIDSIKDANVKEITQRKAKAAERDQARYFTNLPYSQTNTLKDMTESLSVRFNEVAKEQQQAWSYLNQNYSSSNQPYGMMQGVTGYQAPATTTSTGTSKTSGPPPVVPVSPTPPPGDMKAPTGQAPSVPEAASKQREYAHQNNRKGNDFQDTVFWHPALVTQGGAVQVTFDLSSVPTSYRVLLYGHTADGRLGGFQGRLTTRPPGQSQAGKR
jgi:hypothetical protein